MSNVLKCFNRTTEPFQLPQYNFLFPDKTEGSGATEDEDVDDPDKRIIYPGLLNYLEIIFPKSISQKEQFVTNGCIGNR